MMSELPIDPPSEASPEPRRRGRPRSQVRDQIREPLRQARDGSVEVIGHNGEVLTRKRKDNGLDPFDVPRKLWPDGWEYQWNAISVVGNTDILADSNLQMYENGWRPVPPDRHPGLFVSTTKGVIIRGGMRLDERPTELCNEARREMRDKAIRQMRDRDEALMGSKANLGKTLQGQGIPFKGTGDSRGTAVRMQIDPGLDIPLPTRETAEQ